MAFFPSAVAWPSVAEGDRAVARGLILRSARRSRLEGPILRSAFHRLSTMRFPGWQNRRLIPTFAGTLGGSPVSEASDNLKVFRVLSLDGGKPRDSTRSEPWSRLRRAWA